MYIHTKIFQTEIYFWPSPQIKQTKQTPILVRTGYFYEIDYIYTVKLGNKKRFDKEQIGIKEPFPVTNLPFTS